MTVRVAAAAVAASTSLAGTMAPLARVEEPARTLDAVRTATQLATHMSLRQRVGQLFMVGTPATSASPQVLGQISRLHIGNVMLTGRSHAGVRRTARVTASLEHRVTRRSTAGVRLFVATDQEGGFVQVLHGPGFSEMPTGLAQGRLTPKALRADARTWGRQLHRAGLNLDLAPVVDTVPGRAAAADNPPIGHWQREFGYTTRVVGRHGAAFVRGMAAGGVATTAKHFPGLGRVHANTDTAAGVTDTVTRRHDPYLRPFAEAIRAGAMVMMSTAYYKHLDPKRPAAFSPFVIRTVLRGDLRFTGVVISDDLGDAREVSRWSPGARAVKFIRAGGDIVLTVDPHVLPAMYHAVLARARASRAFRTRVDHAVLRVLLAKQRRHLLG